MHSILEILELILHRASPPVTPERDRMAERERSRLRCLDMTGTDERRNSRSRSGTPSRGDNFVPQPVFHSHPVGHSHSGTQQDHPMLPSPIMGSDCQGFSNLCG